MFPLIKLLPLFETAYAMPPGGQGGGGLGSMTGFIPLVLVFAIFWLLVIRPQQKRAKEQRQMNAALRKGDEVITDAGIYGTVQRVGDQQVTLEIAPKVSIRVVRSRIAEMVKETRGKDDKPEEIEDKEQD